MARGERRIAGAPRQMEGDLWGKRRRELFLGEGIEKLPIAGKSSCLENGRSPKGGVLQWPEVCDNRDGP